MLNEKRVFLRDCLMTILSVNNIYGDGIISGVVEKSNAGVSFFVEIKSTEMSEEEKDNIQDQIQNNFWFIDIINDEFHSFLSVGESFCEEIDLKDIKRKIFNLRKVKLISGEDNFKSIYVNFNELYRPRYRMIDNEDLAMNSALSDELASDAYGYARIDIPNEPSYIYVSFDSVHNQVSFLLNKNNSKGNLAMENIIEFLESNLKNIYLTNKFRINSKSNLKNIHLTNKFKSKR